jgi:hypothetical protein
MDFLKTSGTIEPTDISEVGITDGLVGWWPLNGNANDITVNGNDGTVSGATVASGLDQLCYSFDGVNDKIENPHQTYLNSLPITYSCWFNLTSTGGNVINKYFSGSSNGFRLVANASGIGIYYFNSGSNYLENYDAYYGGTLSLNNWYFACATVDGTNGKLYLDGINVGTKNWIGTASAPTTTQILSFGVYPGTSTSYFNGKIQDVRIYNRALSAEEVKIQYELTKNRVMNIDSTGKLYTAGKIIETY